MFQRLWDYPPRIDCFLHDKWLTFFTAISDIATFLLCFAYGVMMISARRKDLRRDQETGDEVGAETTLINMPFGLWLIGLSLAHLGLLISIWRGVYWSVAAIKLIDWMGPGLYSLVVLRKSIAQRRQRTESFRRMKAKIAEFEQMFEKLDNGNIASGS
jgi:hypothetical protein